MLFWWEYCRKGHWEKHLCRQGVKMANFFFILFWTILMICSLVRNVKMISSLPGFSFAGTDDSQDSRRKAGIILYSTHSQTFTYIFTTLHVRWLSRIFNRNACVYKTVTRWDLPSNWITIWLIDWLCNLCLFTWWFDSSYSNLALETGGFELASTNFLRLPLAVNFFVKILS